MEDGDLFILHKIADDLVTQGASAQSGMVLT